MAVPYKAKSVANAFITLSNRDGYSIDAMQLQKHVYHANGYYMAENEGRALVNEYFEAWDYGPVVPTLYYEFREYADRPIKRYAYTFDRKSRRRIVAPMPVADEQTEDIIQWVWENYRNCSGVKLSNMTHKEDGPWDRARKRASNSLMRNERIETADIMEYFGELVEV